MFVRKEGFGTNFIYDEYLASIINVNSILYLQGGANLYGLEREEPLNLYMEASNMPFAVKRDSTLHKSLTSFKSKEHLILLDTASKAVVNMSKISSIGYYKNQYTKRFAPRIFFTNQLHVEIPVNLHIVLARFMRKEAEKELIDDARLREQKPEKSFINRLFS